MNYFYYTDGKQVGPYTQEEMLELSRSGQIENSTIIWREGMAAPEAFGVSEELQAAVTAWENSQKTESVSDGKGVFVGIDFGTTKTMVSRYDVSSHHPRPLRLGRGTDETPTTIYTQKDGKHLFGDEADDEGLTDAPNHSRRFKMKLGEKSLAHVGRFSASAQELSSLFLGHVREHVETKSLHKKISSTVLTVPAIFGPAQHKDLKEAASKAGYDRVELLEEPVAAALAYCSLNHEVSKGSSFLVVDWGGGTLDVAIVEHDKDGEVQIYDNLVDGKDDLGGEVFDDELWSIASNSLVGSGHPSLGEQPPEQWGRFRRELRLAKERLSSVDEVKVAFPLGSGLPVKVSICRTDFENIIRPHVDKAANLVTRLIQKASDNKVIVDFILLVGGTSRIPLVNKVIQEKTGLDCRPWDLGREAIALGAAVRAHNLWGIAEQTLPRDEGTDAALSEYKIRIEVAYIDKLIDDQEYEMLTKFKKSHDLSNSDVKDLEMEVLGGTLRATAKKSSATKELKAAASGTSSSESSLPARKQTTPTRNLEKLLERRKVEICFRSATSEKEIQEWMVEAHQDDPGAQTLLGLCYITGNRVTLDLKEGVRWIQKAADQGETIAQYCLGLNYFYGTGVTPNHSHAVMLFRAAALKGDAFAKNALGKCYQKGLGIAQSDQNAAKWFRSAAEQGNAEAQYALAICHRDGKGVARNQSNYLRWLDAAAKQDLPVACIRKGAHDAKEGFRDLKDGLKSDWKKFWSK